MKMAGLLMLGLILVSFEMPVEDELTWESDYEVAFVKAKKEGKLVLINFTGSDWCGWCKRLDREVFSQSAFKTYADKKLVLLKLDYPRRTPQPQDVKLKNQQLARDFAVRGFPTILLVKSNQQVILRTGYQYGGVEKYIEHLDQAIK